MCTPVGHMLAGWTVWQLRPLRFTHGAFLAAMLIWVNLPDADLLFGFAGGNPNRYHHLWTHSLVFALGMGLAAGLAVWLPARLTARRAIRIPRRMPLQAGALATLGLLSHLLLDLLTRDSSPPYGMQLFWPFSGDFVISPWTPFRDVSKASSSPAFFGSLFTVHNLWTVLVETAIVLPAALGAIFIRKRKKDASP